MDIGQQLSVVKEFKLISIYYSYIVPELPYAQCSKYFVQLRIEKQIE